MNARIGTTRGWMSTAAGAVFGAGLLTASLMVYADSPVTMAPPVQAEASTTGGDSTPNTAADTVFNWSEVPQDQHIPITRAVFDKGGYQLYDSVGETILVPFTNNNLYVMKFAISTDDTMYFVYDGDSPVLYVPKSGYLENATVPGARWYPFTQDFQPSEPVYVGMAPTWDAYVDMGWSPDTWCWGGYWSGEPIADGAAVVPEVGFTVVVGSQNFHGWGAYHQWSSGNENVSHTGWHDKGLYRLANRTSGPIRTFYGAGQPYMSNRYAGAGRQNYAAGAVSAGSPRGRYFAGGEGYRMAASPRMYGGGSEYGGSRRIYGGGRATYGGGGRRSYGGRMGQSRSFNAARRSFGGYGGGRSWGGGGRSYGGGGGRGYGGGRSSRARR